jgi:hypothetical protein
MGLTYNRFHVTAVCSPTRAALLTGRNHHRVGMGGIAEFPGRSPATPARGPELHRAAAHPQGERLRHRRLRQVAHDARPRDGRRRAVRPLAAGLGLRPLVGLPDRRRRAVRPDHHPGQLGPRRARGQGRQALLLPRRHHRQGRRVAPRVRAQDATSRGSSTTRPAPPTRRTTSRRSGPTSTRASSTTAGTPTASGRWSARSARDRPAGHRADRAARPLPGLGLAQRTPRRSSTPARWRSSPASPRTPTGTSGGCSTRSRRWASSTTRSSSTSGATTAPAWRARSPARSTRRPSSTASCSTPSSSWRSSRSTAASRSWAASHTAPHFAAAWAHAHNTPFQWGKQMASHLGGDARPDGRRLAERIKPGGELRTPVHPLHRRRADDPRARGIPEPKVVDGIEQEPMDGTSFAYTLDDPAPRSGTPCSTSRCTAAAPSTRTAGGPAPGSTSCRGTSRRPRSRFAGQRVRPRPGRVGALLPARTTSRRRTTSRPSSPRSSPS